MDGDWAGKGRSEVLMKQRPRACTAVVCDDMTCCSSGALAAMALVVGTLRYLIGAVFSCREHLMATL